MSAVKVKLVPFQESHFDLLIEWSPDAAFLLQWAGSWLGFPLTTAQLRELCAGANTSPPRAYLFTALDAASDRVIGHGELGVVDRRNLSAKLMRVLVGPPELRGTGVGEAIVRALVRYAFAELGLHRVELNVFDFNEVAIRCYERVGFQLEGTLRQARRHGSGYWNSCIMGLLRDEWQAE